jgi:cytochrome c oxidase subunit II
MTKLIIVLIILLGIIAIAQLMRVLELSAQLRNKREEEISAGDNKLNANLMILFMVSLYVTFIYLLANYGGGGLPVAASAHGAETDWLLNINFYLIIAVFFLTNSLLFIFAGKYYYRKDRKAFYFPHDNKLELLWTVVPAAVLAVIIIFGLRTWNDITSFDDANGERVKIELYSKQFEWVARYSGDDNQLGKSDFRLVTGENPLGVQTTASIDASIASMEKMIVDLDSLYAKSGRPADPSEVMTEAARAKTKAKKERMQRHLKKIVALRSTMTAEDDAKANDDRVIKLKEIHLIVNKDYEFLSVHRMSFTLHICRISVRR